METICTENKFEKIVNEIKIPTSIEALVGSEGKEYTQPVSKVVTPELFLSIQQEFLDKKIFITGVTGFLGKVLLEKLLRSCARIEKIFVLMRPVGNATPQARLRKLLENELFDRVRREFPDALLKVEMVDGNIIETNLGLSGKDYANVTSVSTVFHCAATVRFEDDPRNILNVNLLGVHNLLEVCAQNNNLRALVYVSTAYSFSDYSEIVEEIYPDMGDPERIIELLGWMNSAQMKQYCSYFLNGRPSLYHFSKAMAEILIAERYRDLPCIIVRPSIVTAAAEEPYPSGKGIVRTLLLKRGVTADWVPVDIVVNTLIAAACYRAHESHLPRLTRMSQATGVPIVNCTCPDTNLIEWTEVVKLCLPYLIKYPSVKVYYRPGGTVTTSETVYKMCTFFYHYVPAAILDVVFYMTRKRFNMVNFYRRIHGIMENLQHYTTHKFVFRSPNMQRLISLAAPEDVQIFPLDQSQLNWKQYIENYVLGVRRYYMHESDDSLPAARRRMNRITIVWTATQFACIAAILHAVLKKHFPGLLEYSIQSMRRALPATMLYKATKLLKK
ncbi:fatty acyl-CoA reductase 1-like isoform X2 [Stegodyphus dumicola]|uniref:fatty acyl-CoA reductase 1-like isoform X2 n=1 Tax=Stegodyphus dumicola TaxID=202533 RepID=UPI0015AEBDDB|nr:fatty acyl-CoA reductase 1-like isoform X2 [Stegodyphus dumicola]